MAATLTQVLGMYELLFLFKFCIEGLSSVEMFQITTIYYFRFLAFFIFQTQLENEVCLCLSLLQKQINNM